MPNTTVPVASRFARKLAGIAQDQFDSFHTFDENDRSLSAQIEKYWTALGLPFPGVDTAWSAVFVSFCVKSAGATPEEFRFAAAHSEFVHQAIRNTINGTGVFRGYPIEEQAARVGDIIQNNREKKSYDFDFAKRNRGYKSHSAIVVMRGEDSRGKFAMTVGGNETDSIRLKRIDLRADGSIIQRPTNPYICIVKNLK